MFTIKNENRNEYPEDLRNKYLNQVDESCLVKCIDGDIKMSIFGFYHSDFFRRRVEAQYVATTKPIIIDVMFPKSVIKVFLDLLHGITPEPISFESVMQLVDFLSYDEKTNPDSKNFSKFEFQIWSNCFDAISSQKAISPENLPKIGLILASLKTKETTQSLVNMIHCHGVDIFKAELEKFLASIFLNDEILNDVLFSNIPSKDRLNWIKANSKVLMEILSNLPPPTPAPQSTKEPLVSKSSTADKSPLKQSGPLLPDIELPKFSTPDISGLSLHSKAVEKPSSSSKPANKSVSKPKPDPNQSMPKITKKVIEDPKKKKPKDEVMERYDEKLAVMSSQIPGKQMSGNTSQLYRFKSHRFECLGGVDSLNRLSRFEMNYESLNEIDANYLKEPWMQNREFYNLENGIHSMKIPRTGRYQLILAGYGYGESKGAKIQMDMSFIKGVTVNFFMRKGVFVFTDFDSQSTSKSKCPKLIGVAASAGNSTNFKKESSASLSRGNSYSQFFTTNLPTITLDVDQVGFDFDDVLSDRDDDASCGDGYVPGSKIEQEESPRNPDDYEFDSEGGTTMSVDMCAHYDHYVGNPFFEIRFIQ